MKKLFILIFFCLTGVVVRAQDIPANVDKGEQNPYSFITSVLLDVSKSAATSVSNGIARARAMSMPTKNNSIYVEILRGAQEDTDLEIDQNTLQNIPHIELTTFYLNRASAWAEVDQLLTIGQSLPSGYHLCEVILPPEDNQGPGVMNSDSYSGPGGSGRIIAVIDGGFDMLTEARNAGAAPTVANTTVFNYTGNPLESAADGVHGTACLETVFDHAPDAQYVICKLYSVSDMGTAVTDCINNGVDVISHSLSRYNLGWGDNTGAACTAAANASNNGILFFTSCGNRNGTHWQGTFNNPDNDDWHNWSGGDEQNNFTMQGTASNASTVRAYLQWNSASTTDHYDLYLYDSNTNTVLASSTNTNNFETIDYSTNINRAVYLAVLRKTANPPEFELFNHDDACTNFEYASTQDSNTSPSNSTAANVISVGAVAHTSYGDPSGTSGILASYSSRGPTNSNNQAPDLCGPTNTTTVAYGGSFGGTSCATPNAAGAAAAFWSGHSQLNANGVRQILFAKAALYKDWGTAGIDNLYGRGGLFLYDYSSLNRYILKSAGNTTSLTTLPFYSIDDVDDDANPPANHRIIYLDANDTAPGAGDVINKPMLYKSIKGTVID